MGAAYAGQIGPEALTIISCSRGSGRQESLKARREIHPS
jgi:hypothetical protein